MISVEEARRQIRENSVVLETVECVLEEAWGRVLAEDVISDAFYPSEDRSMMDGYVIGAEAEPGDFNLVGEIPAGAVPDQVLGAGEAMRIFTGAILPEGGGRVIMQEEVKRDGDRISIGEFAENLFIRPQGSEATPDQVVLEKGRLLGATELAILAQVGRVRCKVVRPLVVRHLATGNELVPPDQKPGPGQIRDTNSTLLAGLLKSMGIDLSDSHHALDDPQSLAEIAEGDWDILLVSGGASVGDYDFGAEALKRLGFIIHFDRVNLRPGKPLTFATRGKQVAFVIPGNPVSHFVCFQVAIRLAMETMAGREGGWDFLSLKLENAAALKPDPRDTFWPARVSVKDGEWTIAPVRWSTSGDTFSLVGINALARINGNSPADGRVQALLLDLPVSGL